MRLAKGSTSLLGFGGSPASFKPDDRAQTEISRTLRLLPAGKDKPLVLIERKKEAFEREYLRVYHYSQPEKGEEYEEHRNQDLILSIMLKERQIHAMFDGNESPSQDPKLAVNTAANILITQALSGAVRSVDDLLDLIMIIHKELGNLCVVTTGTIALIEAGFLYTANVGNSRALLFELETKSLGKLTETDDNSYLGEAAEEKEFKTKIYLSKREFKQGDLLVLTSDGFIFNDIHGILFMDFIKSWVSQNKGSFKGFGDNWIGDPQYRHLVDVFNPKVDKVEHPVDDASVIIVSL